MKYIAYTSAGSPSLLRKTAALIIAAAVAAAMLMFSAVLLAVLLVLGVVAAAWVWWKTRAVRKMMRQFQAQAANDGAAFRERGTGAENVKGEIIEGEAVRVHEPREGAPH
jgi:ABC-type bacteriocin/lantibiotic exporter with double-glycine peptidase domain